MMSIPVVKIIPKYSTFMISKVANHFLIEYNYPKLTALHIGCKVISLNNILTQYKLVHESLRTVEEIMFKYMDEPRYMCHMKFKYVLLFNLNKVLLPKNRNDELI